MIFLAKLFARRPAPCPLVLDPRNPPLVKRHRRFRRSPLTQSQLMPDCQHHIHRHHNPQPVRIHRLTHHHKPRRHDSCCDHRQLRIAESPVPPFKHRQLRLMPSQPLFILHPRLTHTISCSGGSLDPFFFFPSLLFPSSFFPSSFFPFFVLSFLFAVLFFVPACSSSLIVSVISAADRHHPPAPRESTNSPTETNRNPRRFPSSRICGNAATLRLASRIPS